MTDDDAFDQLRRESHVLELLALLVDCPTCRAQSGLDCRAWPFRRPIMHAHPSRVAAAQRASL